LLSTVAEVAEVDMEGVAVERTPADLEAAVMPADSAVDAERVSQVDTPWWAAPAVTPVDTTADLTTLPALDIQADFAVAMPAHPYMHMDT